MLQGLRQQGYVEGKNLVVERRYAEGRTDRVPQFAKEFAEMKLDAVVTTCTPSTRAARAALSSTPIVMAAVADPVGQNRRDVVDQRQQIAYGHVSSFRPHVRVLDDPAVLPCVGFDELRELFRRAGRGVDPS